MRADGHIPEVVMVSCNGIVATVKWDYKKKVTYLNIVLKLQHIIVNQL